MFVAVDTITSEESKLFFDRHKVKSINLIKCIPGNYRWSGETDNLYFNIIFLDGILYISMDEREMRSTENFKNIAAVDELISINESMKSFDFQSKLSFDFKKIKKQSEDFVEKYHDVDFTISEIMKFLKWKIPVNLEVCNLI